MSTGTHRGSIGSAAPQGMRNECAGCGAAAEPSWIFCGSCGEPLNALPPVPSDDDMRRSGGRSRFAVVWVTVAVLLVAGLATAATLTHLQTRDELQQARNQLASTENRLAKTTVALDETQGELDESQTTLASTRDRFEATKGRLRRKAQQLTGVRGSLDGAQDRLDLQSNQIESLKSCLNGVSNALSYVAYSDYSAAVAALEAVEGSCARANERL